MSSAVSQIAFTAGVRKLQEALGSRAAYARMDVAPDARTDTIGPVEAEFLSAIDSFFMATVGETGWPYVQHRGGPEGFVRVLSPSTIAFADFRGNRQYISAGNITASGRVCLIFLDFARQRRLKLWGHAKLVSQKEDAALLESLRSADYRAVVERAMVISVQALDWNCPQHIPRKFTIEQALELIAEQQGDS